MMTATRRRLRAEACHDWLGLAYRALFAALVTTPVWGAVLAFGVLWLRTQP